MEAIRVTLAGIGAYGGSPAEWNAFAPAQANPAGSIEYAALQRSLGPLPVFLEAWRGDSKISQWLLCRTRRRIVPFAPLVADCGPQVADAAVADSDDVFVAFADFVRRRLRPRDLRVLKYALVRGISRSALTRAGFQEIEEHPSYVSQIADDATMLAAFHDSHRNDTRKALRDELRYSGALPSAEYLRLSRITYERSGLIGPEPALIEGIDRTLVAGGKALCSGVYAGEELVAASVVLHHGHNAFYLHGASSPAKPRGATTLIHFENMRRLRERGVRSYDFGGAREGDDADDKARSIAAFKRRFGGARVVGYGGRYRWF